MWMKGNEQLTLNGKIIVACFELLSWIYNSKGRKGNGLDGYGHGLVLMFLMKLVLWRPIMHATVFLQWSFNHPKPAKKTWHKEHKYVKKEMANSYLILMKNLNVKWNRLRKIKSVIFSPIHDIDNNPFLRNNHEK